MSPDTPEKRPAGEVLNPPENDGGGRDHKAAHDAASDDSDRPSDRGAASRASTGNGGDEGPEPIRGAARRGLAEEGDRADSEPDREAEHRAATGAGGTELERRAAKRLAAELERTGREVELQEIAVRAGQGPVVAAHSALAVAGSLIGLLSPIAGAAVVLLTAFSFYGERGLGMFLLSRLLPRRRVRNIVSPPLGPVWENEIDTILVAGYDAPPSYPAGDLLARGLGGRLTTDRLVFWAGMLPVFAALMLRLATVDGFWVQLIQILGTAVLLALFTAQIDRHLKGEVLGVEEDLTAARDLIATVDELEREEEQPGAAVGLCLFGAESDDAAGAEAFYSDPRLKVRPGVAVIGLVTAAPDGKPEATGREGDLTGVRMEFALAAGSPLKPREVAIRRDTAAGRARRRGARATTLVGRDEEGIELVFDAIEAAVPEEEG